MNHPHLARPHRNVGAASLQLASGSGEPVRVNGPILTVVIGHVR